MNSIKDYDVIKSAKLDELIVLVKARTKDGWTILEGVQTQVQPAPGGGGFITYLQTVVKLD